MGGPTRLDRMQEDDIAGANRGGHILLGGEDVDEKAFRLGIYRLIGNSESHLPVCGKVSDGWTRRGSGKEGHASAGRGDRKSTVQDEANDMDQLPRADLPVDEIPYRLELVGQAAPPASAQGGSGGHRQHLGGRVALVPGNPGACIGKLYSSLGSVEVRDLVTTGLAARRARRPGDASGPGRAGPVRATTPESRSGFWAARARCGGGFVEKMAALLPGVSGEPGPLPRYRESSPHGQFPRAGRGAAHGAPSGRRTPHSSNSLRLSAPLSEPASRLSRPLPPRPRSFPDKSKVFRLPPPRPGDCFFGPHAVPT